MRTLKRPMFKIGGKAEAGNDGIMSGLVDRKQLENGTALQKFQSIGDIKEIMPYNMSGAEIKDKYDFDFPINLKSTFIAENPQPQNIKIGEGGSEYFVGGKPEFKKKPDEFYLGQEDPQGSLEGITFPKTDEVKKLLQPDTEPEINLKDAGSNVVTQAEKNDILKARAKEFEELLNPGARKRVINNALAAASAEFGKSEGNTMQDIANAITAAAGATGKMDETKQKAAELAIGESIQKGIYQSKDKDNTYETLIKLGRSDNPEDQKMFGMLTKGGDKETDTIIKIAAARTDGNLKKATGDFYEIKAGKDKTGSNEYGGTLTSKLVKGENVTDFNSMVEGKVYFNPNDLTFYTKKDGQIQPTTKPSYLN